MLSSKKCCHFCTRPYSYLKESFVAVCSFKRCSKAYCLECIQTNFTPEFTASQYKEEYWICYYCQKSCSCSSCSLTLEKKKSKRKPKVYEESGENESIKEANKHENLEEILMKNDSLKCENESKLISKEDKITIDNINKYQIIRNEKEEHVEQLERIEEKHVNNRNDNYFKFISQYEINEMAPFMQKIAIRKNQFYNFCRNQESLSQSPAKEYKNMKDNSNKKTDKYKEIIKNAFKENEIDDDEFIILPN